MSNTNGLRPIFVDCSTGDLRSELLLRNRDFFSITVSPQIRLSTV